MANFSLILLALSSMLLGCSCSTTSSRNAQEIAAFASGKGLAVLDANGNTRILTPPDKVKRIVNPRFGISQRTSELVVVDYNELATAFRKGKRIASKSLTALVAGDNYGKALWLPSRYLISVGRYGAGTVAFIELAPLGNTFDARRSEVLHFETSDGLTVRFDASTGRATFQRSNAFSEYQVDRPYGSINLDPNSGALWLISKDEVRVYRLNNSATVFKKPVGRAVIKDITLQSDGTVAVLIDKWFSKGATLYHIDDAGKVLRTHSVDVPVRGDVRFGEDARKVIRAFTGSSLLAD